MSDAGPVSGPRVAAAVGLTALLWAAAFPGIRVGLTGYSPGELVCLRFVVASLTLLAVAPLAGVRLPERRDLPRLALLGLLAVPAYHLPLSYGELHVESGAASVLVNTAPLFTAMLGVTVLKERLSAWGWLGLLVSFAGSVVIAAESGGGFGLDPWALLIVTSAVAASFMMTMQKPLLRRYRPLDLTVYMFVLGTIPLLWFAPGVVRKLPVAPPLATWSIVALGILPAAVAYLSWAYVLSHVPASRAGSFLYVVPVLAFLIAWAWLGEVPSMVMVAGASLVLAGVIVVNTLGRASGGGGSARHAENGSATRR